MTAGQVAHGHSTGPSEKPIPAGRFWSVTLPGQIQRWTPSLANALADGAWTAIWPRVVAYAPVAGLAVGVATALLLPFTSGDYGAFSGIPRVWSELLLFMILVVAAGFLSGAVGLALVAGYVIGDLVWLGIGAASGQWTSWVVLDPNPAIAALQVAGSALVSWILLAIPSTGLPAVARTLAARARLRGTSNGALGVVVWGSAYALAAGLLTYLWTLAVVVLIRPMFTWRIGDPPVQAIEPVQFQWQWLVGAAVAAVVVRILLQERLVRPSPHASRVAVLQLEREADATRGRRLGGPLVPIVGTAALLTLLLAGTYQDFIDPIVVFVAGALVAAWRDGLIGVAPTAWVERVERIPALGRIAVVLVAGYLMALIVAQAMWTTDSLRAVLIGALLTGAVLVFLFPARADPTAPQRSQAR